MLPRSETNRRYYNRFRKVHIGPLAPLCRQRGPIGPVATCKTCMMVQKARAVGTALNEWEAARLKKLFKAQSAARSKAWRKRNPAKASAACMKWRTENHDVYLIYMREWRQKQKLALRRAT